MKSIRRSLPLNEPGPNSLTLQPLTLLGPPAKYLFQKEAPCCCHRARPPQADVHRQMVALVEEKQSGVIEIELHVLGIRRVEDDATPLCVFVQTKQWRTELQQIAGCLKIALDGIYTIIICDTKTCFHDQKVLIVIAQNSIPIADTVQIVMLESGTDPRHVDITEVDKVKPVSRMMVRLRPPIAPRRREITPMKLRTILKVIAQADFTRGIAPTLERP